MTDMIDQLIQNNEFDFMNYLINDLTHKYLSVNDLDDSYFLEVHDSFWSSFLRKKRSCSEWQSIWQSVFHSGWESK